MRTAGGEHSAIRAADDGDAEAIARIYNHYILNTVVTFEEETITATDMSARMADVASASLPWLVAELHGRVVGYAYATKWKGRSAYRFTAESTVYLDPESVGQRVGTALYGELLNALRSRSIHSVLGGHRATEPRQRGPSRADGLPEGGSPQRARIQVRSVDRRRLLAARALIRPGGRAMTAPTPRWTDAEPPRSPESRLRRS